jgi:hypothetical protein
VGDEDWGMVKCPVCMKLNKMPEKIKPRPNIDLNKNYLNILQYTLVICPFCHHQMKTKTDSVYIICSKCKHSVLIAKDHKGNPDSHFLFKMKYDRMFNPYYLPDNDPLFLQRDFEKEFVENTKKLINEKKKVDQLLNDIKPRQHSTQLIIDKPKQGIYKPMINTIKIINENLKILSEHRSSPSNRKSSISEIVNRNLFNN